MTAWSEDINGVYMNFSSIYAHECHTSKRSLFRDRGGQLFQVFHMPKL